MGYGGYYLHKEKMINPRDLLDPKKIQEIENISKSNASRDKHHRLYGQLPKKLSKEEKKSVKRKRKLEKTRKYAQRVPKKYHIYIKSSFWEARKSKFYRKFGRKCAVCSSSRSVQVHHKFYGEYGIEKDEHLVALCGFHHEQVHIGIGKTKKDMVKETDAFVEEMRLSHERGDHVELQRQDDFIRSLGR